MSGTGDSCLSWAVGTQGEALESDPGWAGGVPWEVVG